MSEDDVTARIDAQLGTLSLTVEGESEDWVSRTYDEKLERLLTEASEMSDALRNGTRGCE